MNKTHVCSRCGVEKLRDEFHRRANRPSGIRSQCKECVREPARRRAAAWYARHRDRANAAKRQRRKDNPDWARELDKRQYARAKENPRYVAYQKRYRERNVAALRDYHRRWREANPDKLRQYADSASPEAKANAAEYVRRRKDEQHAVLDTYKRERGCLDCGTREGVLDFDHRDDEEKRWAVSQALGCSWDSLWAEIAKCEIRCRPCHARRHVLAGHSLHAA